MATLKLTPIVTQATGIEMARMALEERGENRDALDIYKKWRGMIAVVFNDIPIKLITSAAPGSAWEGDILVLLDWEKMAQDQRDDFERRLPPGYLFHKDTGLLAQDWEKPRYGQSRKEKFRLEDETIDSEGVYFPFGVDLDPKADGATKLNTLRLLGKIRYHAIEAGYMHVCVTVGGSLLAAYWDKIREFDTLEVFLRQLPYRRERRWHRPSSDSFNTCLNAGSKMMFNRALGVPSMKTKPKVTEAKARLFEIEEASSPQGVHEINYDARRDVFEFGSADDHGCGFTIFGFDREKVVLKPFCMNHPVFGQPMVSAKAHWQVPWDRLLVRRSELGWHGIFLLHARQATGRVASGDLDQFNGNLFADRFYAVATFVAHDDTTLKARPFRSLPAEVAREIYSVPGMASALGHMLYAIKGALPAAAPLLADCTMQKGEKLPAGHLILDIGANLSSDPWQYFPSNLSGRKTLAYNVIRPLDDASVLGAPTLLPPIEFAAVKKARDEEREARERASQLQPVASKRVLEV